MSVERPRGSRIVSSACAASGASRVGRVTPYPNHGTINGLKTPLKRLENTIDSFACWQKR